MFHVISQVILAGRNLDNSQFCSSLRNFCCIAMQQLFFPQELFFALLYGDLPYASTDWSSLSDSRKCLCKCLGFFLFSFLFSRALLTNSSCFDLLQLWCLFLQSYKTTRLCFVFLLFLSCVVQELPPNRRKLV